LSLIIEPYSFGGDASRNRRTIAKEPYNYKNVLIMEGMKYYSVISAYEYDDCCD